MAEWKDCGDNRRETRVGRIDLSVWYSSVGGRWMFTYEPLAIASDDNYRPLNATDAEAAQIEALHIVGEWGKQVAIEAAELRERMVKASYYAHWIPEDELPEGYPYNLAFDKSRIVDGVRMFPPFNEQNSAPATPGEG